MVLSCELDNPSNGNAKGIGFLGLPHQPTKINYEMEIMKDFVFNEVEGLSKNDTRDCPPASTFRNM